MGRTSRRVSAIVYVYNSYMDPLFQSTLWKYLLEESVSNRFNFYLITFEQKEYELVQSEKNRVKTELRKKGIYWYPLKWHSGHLKLFLKAWDFITSLFLSILIRLIYQTKIVISLGTVAGSFAYLLSRMLLMKSFIYQFERHSEFLKDFGIWKGSTISFSLLNYLESISGNNSEWIATGTNHMLERLKREGAKGKTYLLPSCVDENIFDFRIQDRNKLRKSLGIDDRLVIIYVGKFGGIYYNLEDITSFLHNWKVEFPQSFFIILTPQNQDEIRKALGMKGINSESSFVGIADYSEVPSWISASDLGLVAVPSLPSQKFRSPIKVGEYLCCGIPYIVGQGISEDDVVAKKNNVGIVLSSYTRSGIIQGKPTLNQLIDENRLSQRTRCRLAGIEYRGFSTLKRTGAEIFDDIHKNLSS